MILTRETILKLIKKGDLHIEPFDESLIEEDSILLQVSPLHATIVKEYDEIEIREVGHHITNYMLRQIYRYNRGRIVLEPNTVTLTITEQYITLPRNVAGFITIRSTFARMGILVPKVSYIHCGWNGRVVMPLVNMSPITIKIQPGTKMFQLILVKCDKKIDKICGRYMGQMEIMPPQLKQEDF